MTREIEVYVILTNTGTLFSKTIKLFTRDALNHASIAFDSELNEVYSFGRLHQQNPFLAGFVKENMRGQLFEQSDCALYRCRVNESNYVKMRDLIQHMEKNRDLYRYNFLGVVGVLFNIQMKREYSYFCSQFVASVFEESGVHLLNKSSLLVTPGDLETTTKLELVYEGALQSYISMNMDLNMNLNKSKNRTLQAVDSTRTA